MYAIYVITTEVVFSSTVLLLACIAFGFPVIHGEPQMQQYPDSHPIRYELLAAALGRSIDGVKLCISTGRIPPQDAKINRKTSCWTLGTLRAWNPRVARRIDMLLIALR